MAAQGFVCAQDDAVHLLTLLCLCGGQLALEGPAPADALFLCRALAAAVGAQEGGGVAEVVRRYAPAHAPDAHHRAVVALLVDAEASGTALERLGVEAAGDVVRPRLDERFLKILHDRSFLLRIGEKC